MKPVLTINGQPLPEGVHLTLVHDRTDSPGVCTLKLAPGAEVHLGGKLLHVAPDAPTGDNPPPAT